MLLAAASIASCGSRVHLPFLPDAEPAAIPIVEAHDRLEDNDPIEPVDAGVSAKIGDDPQTGQPARIFEHATLRPDLALNAPVPQEGKFVETFGLIRRHAATYDFDPLLIVAQGYQESGLDQSKRSPVGAIGIMQVMPATARDPNVGIPDIHIAERNVEAGIKYLRFLSDRYFSDPTMSPLDRTLFSRAAYNAGPGNIAKARQHAEQMGLDPNVWFNSVELAAARAISREPVVYVRNILTYYVAHPLLEERRAAAGE